MTLQDFVEKHQGKFVAIPVVNVRYWAELETYIGEALVETPRHSGGSTIAFDFFEEFGYRQLEPVYLAYKVDHRVDTRSLWDKAEPLPDVYTDSFNHE